MGVLSLSCLVAGAGIAYAQFGNHGSPYPNVTWPDAISPNPAAVAGAQSNQQSPPKYPSPWGTGAGDWADAYKKAISMVEQMTLEEKVNLTTGTGWHQEQCVGQTGAVPRLGIRGICLQDSPVGVRYTDFVSVFPSGVNVAATWNKGLAYARGQAQGYENRDKGITVMLGPVAGPLGRAPEGGRNWEGFSPDPYLTGILFADTIRGIQSTGVEACAKHLVGNEQEHFRQYPESIDYGFNITEPGSSNIDDQTLHELYVWPFMDAVKAGVASVMCSYNLLNNSQACQNSYLLNHVLKGELGYQGYVMSDWQADASGVSAILAGLDMTMAGDTFFGTGTSYFGPNLTIAVLNGTVPQWRLDDMAVRILSSWYYVGADEIDLPNFQSWTQDTYGPVHAQVGPSWGTGVVNQHVDVRQQHGALIRQIGADSTVLLKNTKHALPLTNKEKLTAVFGEDAASNPLGANGCSNHGCDTGTLGVGWGSGQANFPYLVSPDAALQHEVVSRYGSYQAVTNNSALTQVQALAKRAGEVDGVCIVFGNADSGEGFINIEGNYGDRKNVSSLWQNADAVVQNVSANCNNTVLVIHSVGAVEIEDYKNHPNITAILWAGLPGEQSGNSIADVLYGRVNPGAKLPFTIGKERSDYGADVLYTPNQPVPQYNFQEGVFIDYRTFDQRNITPTYEFGFGLSYTTFDYSNIRVEKLETEEYQPTTGRSEPAPTYGSVDNSTSAHVFPSNITRIPLFIYPWLNSSSLNASYGAPGFGDNSFVPEGALDGSPYEHTPSSGPNGGNAQLWDNMYCVHAQITNTGEVVGEEVAQLYLSTGGPYDPKNVLRGFERLSIQPGESVDVTFYLTRRDLSNWDTEAQNWLISDYTKTVHVGSSSRALHLSASLQ